METKGISTTIISAIRKEVAEEISEIAQRVFDGANIQIVEKKFIKTMGHAGNFGLSELFAINDESKKAIIYGGKKHYQKYITIGRYLTLLGEVQVKRGIYQSNQEKCSICPLELKLKFINDYVSYAASEYICYSLASMTLSEFIKHCRKWALMKPSEGTVKRVLDYVGNFLEQTDFLNMIRSEEHIPDEAVTLAMSMDATSIQIRQDGWRQATVATVSSYDASGNRLDTVYIGRMPESDKTRAKRMLEAEVQARIEKQKFRHIVCIADGARDLWLYFRRKYPHAIHILDFFHVCEHISKLSALLFADPTDAKAWFKKYRKILKEDPEGAAKLLRSARYRRSIVSKNPDIDSEIRYLQHNKAKMNYFEYRQKGLPIGSGVVEAACKNLIGARMKKSGMRWTIDGGQTILTLRSLILSNRWEKFWLYFICQHFPDYQT
jgi:hypothetical protein